MERQDIFKIAMLDYNGEFKDMPNTVFSVLEKMIRGVDLSQIAEEDKVDKLGSLLNDLVKDSRGNIMGVKKQGLGRLVNGVFKLRNGSISNPYLQGFNMDQILYYYCCISRMARSGIGYSQEDIARAQEEVEAIIEAREEKIRAEEAAREEAIRKAEEEERAKEEAARKAEEERLANMSDFELKLEKIKKDKREENYVKLFDSMDEFEKEDKIAAAKLLKEHWMASKNKWEGKLSKKQKIKVKEIKDILGEK